MESARSVARDGPGFGGAWTAALVLALLAALCSAPLLRPGWFANQEEIRPIARALFAYQEIAAGDLYPRWISSGYLGKGMPLFEFYPPAYSFVVAWLHAAGVPLIAGAKLVLYGLFLAGALGAYLWIRRHLGHFAALTGAILYLFAPYHFVDVYVRGATAEFFALAALPFLFLGVDLLLERGSPRGFGTLAVSSASIVVSHFLGALMIAPLAAVYVLAGVLRRGAGWRALGRVAGGVGLGAGLSAFYWLPAIAERGALSPERLERANSGYYDPFLHFVHPGQWLDPTWGFGASAPDGFPDGMSFQIGLLLLACVGASLLLGWGLARAERRFVLLVLALGGVAVWLTHGSSAPVYAAVAPLRWVQFPWRFLGPATVFLAAAGAGFVRVVEGRARALAPSLAALVAAGAVALSASQRTVEGPMPVDDDLGAIEAAVAADPWAAKSGNEDEYLPRDASVAAAATRRGGPQPWGIGVAIGDVRPGHQEVTFEVAQRIGDGLAFVPWHAFPGWKVTLDGRPHELVPGPDGIIAFWVPPGPHVARVYFGTTPSRVAGWALCLASLAALGGLAVGGGLNRLRRRAAAGARPA